MTTISTTSLSLSFRSLVAACALVVVSALALNQAHAETEGAPLFDEQSAGEIDPLGTNPSALASAPINPDTSPCGGLLKECVALDTDRRSSCFQAAARDERCAHTELARLAFLRSTLSSDQGGQEFALLGPQFVNKECVERFDNQLSGNLIRGSIPDETIRGLYGQLQQCQVEAIDDVFRP